jgi:hypothetical protein
MSEQPTNPVPDAAARLQAAATHLCTLLAVVPPAPCRPGEVGVDGRSVQVDDLTSSANKSLDTRMDSEQGRALARYIAAMHPGVGEALAALLTSTAALHEQPTHRGQTSPGCQWCADEDWLCSDMRHALAVADAILAGAEQ